MSLKVKLSLRRAHDGKHQHYTCPTCPYKTKKRRQFKAHQFVCGEALSSSSDTDIVDSSVVAETNPDHVPTPGNTTENDGNLVNGDAAGRGIDATETVSRKRKLDDDDSDDQEVSLKLPSEDAVSTFSSDATEIQDNNDKHEGSISSAAPVGASPSGSRRVYARKYRCKYPRCEFETKNSRQFLLHERSEHYQDFAIYVCDMPSCEYSSKWLDKVLRHRTGVHGTKVPWKGETLPSPSKSSPKQAQLNGKRTLKTLTLESSGNAATSKRVVKRRKVETTNFDSDCELDPSLLSSSIRVLSSGPTSRFQCSLCGYTHVRRHQLKVHLILRHFNTKQFQCSFPGCSYVCNNKSDLFLHKNLHSDRTMHCQECDYTTVLKANLERHYKNHKMKNALYRCNICTYGGLREANVVRHLNEHHYKSEEKRVLKLGGNAGEKKQKVELKIPSFKCKTTANDSGKGAEESKSLFPENQAVFPGPEVERSSVTIGGKEVVGLSAEKPVTEEQPIEVPLLTQQSHSVVDAASAASTSRPLLKKNRREMLKPHRVGKAEKAYYARDDGMLRCRFCVYEARTMFKMRAHMSVHSRKGDVKCWACAYKCRRMVDLQRHIEESHAGQVAPPLTPIAGKALDLSVESDLPVAGPSREPAVLPAMNFSDKFTDDELICKSCSYIGKFPSDLQKHMASAHDENKQYACAICQRRYRWQQDLTNHTRMAHEGKIAAAKKGGTKRFQRRSARKRRLTLKRRTNLKPNELREQPTRLFCRLCDYVATCRTHLIRHAESHTNKVAYHCEVCGYATQRKSDIKRHLEKYHSTKYSSEFLINLYIEKLEEDVIDGIMDHERSVEALYEGADLDHDDDNRPIVQESNLPSTNKSLQPCEPTKVTEPMEATPVAVKVNEDEEVIGRRGLDDSVKSEPMSEDDPESSETKSCTSDSQSQWFRVEESATSRRRRFYCNLCDYSAVRIDYITFHCSAHENLKRYVCTVCGERLNHRGQIYTHVSSAHGKEAGIKADMMSVVTRLSHEEARETLEEYHRKRLELSPGLPIKFGTLPTTPIVPETEGDFRTHKLKQAGSMLCCSRCPYYSPNVGKLNKHIRVVHAGEATFVIHADSIPDSLSEEKPPELSYLHGEYSRGSVRSLLDAQRKASGSDTGLSTELALSLDQPSTSQASQDPTRQPCPDRARRYKCSLCFYRSNQYDDTEGHIDKQHPNTRVAHVDILPLDEALATLDAYEKAFHGKNSSAASRRKDVNAYDSPPLPTKRSESIPVTELFDGQSYQCPKCDFKDENSNIFRLHSEMHQVKGAKLDLKMFTCSICFFTTNYHNSLYRHIKHRHKINRLARRYVLKKAAARKALSGGLRLKGAESRTSQVLKSLLTPEANETGAKVARVKTSDLDNLPKGTRIYRCSICAFTTPWLASMEKHIGQSHADMLSSILKKGAGVTSAAAAASSSLTLEQPVRVPTILPLTPPNISPSVSRAATSQQVPASPIKLITTPTQLQLLTSALQLTATSSSQGMTASEQRGVALSSRRVLTLTSTSPASPPNRSALGVVSMPLGRPSGMVRPDELKFVTVPTGRLFLCTYCPYRHEKPQHLADHLQFHSPHPSRPQKCSFCPYWVKKPYNLNRHTPLHKNQQSPKPPKQTTHADSKALTLHVCGICPYFSRSKEDLESHKLYHCSTGKVKCEQCLYSVSTLRHLTQHAKVHTHEYKHERERLQNALLTAGTKTSNNNNTIAHDNELGRNAASTSAHANQQPLRVQISMPHKTTGQKMMSPSKQGSTYDPVLVASLKHDIVASRITPAVLATLPSDEDLVVIPIAGKNANNVDVILHKNREILNKRQRLTRCRYCPYSHITAGLLERHEAMHGIQLEEQGLRTDTLLNNNNKCAYCDHYSTTPALVREHEKVHRKSYVPNIDDVPELLPAGRDDVEKIADMKLTENKSTMGANTRIDSKDPPRRPDIPFKVEFDESRGQHVVRALLPSKLSCERCPYGTTNKNHFERHVTLHGSRQLYTCQFCDYSVVSNPMLQLHTKLHLKPNCNLLQVQTLNNLSRLTSMPADEAVALRTNTKYNGNNNNNNNNDNPNDPLMESIGLHDHLDLYENAAPVAASKGKERQRFLCNRCPFSTIGECWLTMHLRCHGVQNAWTCPYCDYSCTQERVLNSHIKLHFVPKDAQGSKAKNKDVFVRSHSIEQLDVGSGDVVASDVAEEKEVVQNDVVVDTDETTKNNDEENKTSDVTALADLTLADRTIERMEVDSGHAPEHNRLSVAPVQASVTLAKSFAEFAASAVLMSPDKILKEPKFNLRHGREVDAVKGSDSVNIDPSGENEVSTDCGKNWVSEDEECNETKEPTLENECSEERSEITVEGVRLPATARDVLRDEIHSSGELKASSGQKASITVSMETEGDGEACVSQAKKSELAKMKMHEKSTVSENTKSPETVKNEKTDPVEESDEAIIHRKDFSESSDRTVSENEKTIEKSAPAIQSVSKKPSSTDILETSALMESTRNESTPFEQNNSLKTVTIVSDVPLPLQQESGQIGRPGAHAQNDASDSASFNCPYCERSFTNSAFLQKHKAQHLIGNHYYYYYD